VTARPFFRLSTMKKFLASLEMLLVAGGALALGWYGAAKGEAFLYQQRQERELEQEIVKPALTSATPPRAVLPDAESGRPHASEGRASAPARHALRPVPRLGTLARIEIPRLNLKAMIGEGIDDRTLAHAVGHVPGTARPGDMGNVVLAGHRDSFFRGIGGIRRDDEIRVTTPSGTYDYSVDGVEVVDPDDVQVMAPRSDATLTLVSCFPFDYVGPAPKRFVVVAHRKG
jgi:sortase A